MTSPSSSRRRGSSTPFYADTIELLPRLVPATRQVRKDSSSTLSSLRSATPTTPVGMQLRPRKRKRGESANDDVYGPEPGDEGSEISEPVLARKRQRTGTGENIFDVLVESVQSSPERDFGLTVKRGRGRPKKGSGGGVELTYSPEDSSGSAATGQKRGPGRPRKNPVSQTASRKSTRQILQEAKQQAVRRRPGRPRKQGLPSELSESTVSTATSTESEAISPPKRRTSRSRKVVISDSSSGSEYTPGRGSSVSKPKAAKKQTEQADERDVRRSSRFIPESPKFPPPAPRPIQRTRPVYILLEDVTIFNARFVEGVEEYQWASPEECIAAQDRWDPEWRHIVQEMWWAGYSLEAIEQELGASLVTESALSDIQLYLRQTGLWFASAIDGTVS